MSAAFLFLFLTTLAAPAGAEKLYYAVEINGTVCGYAELETSPLEEGGGDAMLLKHKLFLMISALGSEFNSNIELTYHLDASTGQFTYHDSYVNQGDVEFGSRVVIDGDTARFTDTMNGDERAVGLSEDVLLENTLYFPHLVRDFVDGEAGEKTYRILDVREMEIQNCTYKEIEREEIKLAGERFKAIVLDKHIHETGVRIKVWIDTDSGKLIRTELPNNRKSYLAKSSVVKRIEVANLNESVITKANVSIADIKSISYMKVRGIINPTGLVVSEEGLNIPGQSFEGTTDGNRIEGVFEVEHPRYEGADAPPFPSDFSGDEALREFLVPESMIESDDPVLVEKAEEVTAGAKDAWEAAVRLSEWVSENIGYAIPGGATARKTYDLMAGECGAHSILLAAFCRGVGIPARVVWGCMYIPNYGGSFGQHAWNEIYMGDAGWIPVDATASETDFLDSGHIRIGIYQSLSTALNAEDLEILDYRLLDTAPTDNGVSLAEQYNPFLGRYQSESGYTTVEVLVKEGGLAVDIPRKIVLALNEPDDRGRWISKISDKVYCTFETGDNVIASAVYIHEVVHMPRTAGPEEIPADVPDEYRAHLGTYRFAAARADFTVRYLNGSLAIDDPLEKSTVGLQHPDEHGGWLDQYGKNTIYFNKDEDGNVTALKIDARNRFNRTGD